MCSSDLYLLYSIVVELQKGDILSYEFCSIVDKIGSAVKNLKKSNRVVASF